ncbi:hypothetical protein [Micromonospora luteifusca]|uniref:hypothetical protein n=1 Tax=Micromonospora luteifusca TaxID=709860 RepID=UPI0033B68FEF
MIVMHPIRRRGYRFPEPAALRVAPDGLHVHLGEHGRPGRCLHLPWPAAAQLNLVEGPLATRKPIVENPHHGRRPRHDRRFIDADGR